MDGKHICFCGLDGSGKTTQAIYLQQYIIEKGGKSEIIHGFKPGKYNTSLKEYARKNGNLFREAYDDTIRSISYICDMYEVYYEKIEPLLCNGYIVISDKFVMDSLVNAPLLGANEKMLYDFASTIPNPMLYIYMDITPDEAYNRVLKRNAQESGSRKNRKDFMEKSYIVYKELENKYDNVVSINALKDEVEIRTDIINLIEERNII